MFGCLCHRCVTIITICLLIYFDSLSVQLQLLLQYLKDDPRKAVKRLAINDLKLLAKKAPHLWIRENTQVVFLMLRVALLDCSMLV